MKINFFYCLFIIGIVALIVMGPRNTIAAAESSTNKQEENVSTKRDGQNSTLAFKWAILHRDQQAKVRVLNFKEEPIVHSGDSLRMFLWPLQGVFLYVYLYDSKKNLSPLFPQTKEIYKVGKPYYIPDEDGWFEIDTHTGMEIFYLIASKNRLTDLERLTREFVSAPPEKKTEAQFNVLAEIKNVRKQYSQFPTPSEKPVPITGTSRFPESQTKLLATQVETEVFYGKTLRLIHK